MKQSRYVKSKIAAGYILVLAVSVVAIWRVFAMATDIASADDRSQLRSRRNAINRTLYHLYQAESSGQMMLAGDESYRKSFRSELALVRSCIDSLRATVAETDNEEQTERLDSIELLIDRKERTTIRLIETWRAANSPTIVERNIERIILPDSTIHADTLPAAHVSVLSDTLRTARSRRGFFRRFADLFSPPKEDSTITVRTNIRVDSVAGGMSDTIAVVLRDLQEKVTAERSEIAGTAWREVARISRDNRLINNTIYRLIDEFEREESAVEIADAVKRQAVIRRSTTLLGSIAAAAIVLVLLFVVILWRDISRSNRYKAELERANREKETLLSTREQLMLAITHDIKAPLGSIMGYIDLMSRLDIDRRGETYLHNMRQSSEHLLRLVTDLVEFHRLDTDRDEAESVTFSPARLFESIVDGFRPIAAAKGVELLSEASSDSAAEVTGDPMHIRQIADNLISNALKFTDSGSVSVALSLDGDALRFVIADTGRGIAPEERERIFEAFVRLGSARGIEGFGLGLSIVDRAVRLLGGEVELESEPGRGSRFTVRVPVSRTAQPARPADGIRLLALDDDKLQLDMVAAMCRSVGIDITTCQFPEYIERLLNESRFDAVMTDIQMPGTDGFAIAATVRRLSPATPVVAVTARAGDDGEFLARGFSAVLHKPFAASDLLRALSGMAGVESAVESRSAAGFEALTAFAGGDSAAEADILRTFAAESRADAAALKQAADSGDAKLMRATAHKLAPRMEMTGRTDLSSELRRMERSTGWVISSQRDFAARLHAEVCAMAAEAEALADKAGAGNKTGGTTL
ncbi:MAG: hybrid sensor histidine kinase/response regulator [Alistipes sp.]|nr:hybrid sensor histidine kinase/response regulator [Alistipes sp.]